jgi:hypothetical protein
MRSYKSLVVCGLVSAMATFGCVMVAAGPSDGGATGGGGSSSTGNGTGTAGTKGGSGAAGSSGGSTTSSGAAGTGAGGSATGAGGSAVGQGGTSGITTPFCVDQGPDCIRACGLTSFPVQKLPPEILIIFDQSISMVDPATGGSCGMPTACGSKWMEMTTAVTSVVTTTDKTINWGLKLFADMGACGVLPGATVPVAINNGAAITAALMATGPKGHTPTRLAVQAGAAYLQTLTTPNPKFILLATDGIPNCIPGNKSQTAYDMAGATQAVADALALGLPTFVLGVGTGGGTADAMVFDPTLTSLSAAGGKARAGTPNYYHVSSSADVVAALAMIQSQANSCVFNLAQVPPDPTNIAIRGAGGVKIPKDPTHANGWDYGPGMKSVQLYGSYCMDVVSGVLKDVQAVFGCPMQVIP